MIEALQDLPIEEFYVRLIVAPHRERRIANNGCGQHSSSDEQRLFCVVKELQALQAVRDLREYAQKRRIRPILVTLALAVPHKLQDIGDRQAGHDTNNASLDQFDHIDATPTFQHAEFSVRSVDDRPHTLRHQRLFELQVAEVLVLAAQLLEEIQTDRSSSGIEVLNQQWN